MSTTMGQPDAFALGRSNLNGFLFADIGVESSGMPLSVISALARQGLDPWQEARRLARLPRASAADGLARLIAAMPASLWPMPDAAKVAARLVALLPGHGAQTTGASTTRSDGEARHDGPWLIVAIAVVTLLVGLSAYVAPAPGGPPAVTSTTVAPIPPVPTGG